MEDRRFIEILFLVLVHNAMRFPRMTIASICSTRCLTQPVANTCLDALNQVLPTCVYETDPAGTCLMSLNANINLTFRVNTMSPPELTTILNDYFQLIRTNTTTRELVLSRHLDVESVYLNTNVSTLDVQMTVICNDTTRLTTDSIAMNLTVVDADDNSPTFSQSADSTCLLPVFTATADEEYIGPLSTVPSCLCPTDGDFLTNNDVILSLLHGDPPDFVNFFSVDIPTNTINKTANMSSDDPHTYTFVIQARENSTIGRSMVAVLSVGIESGASTVTSTESKANESVRRFLQVLSATILTGFMVGFVILVWHRNKRVNPFSKPKQKIVDDSDWMKPRVANNHAHDTEENSPKLTLESIDEEPERT